MTRIARVAGTLIVLSLLALAVPSEGRAADCGSDYLSCVTSTVDSLNSSDALHEQQCYSEYIRCVSLMIMAW